MSILSIEKKFIFIHIPKTAGTSMEENEWLKGSWFKHHNIEFFRDSVRQIKEYDMGDFFKFAFVRNPYTRLASGIVRHNLSDKVDDKETFSNWIIENKQNMIDLKDPHNWLHMIPMYKFITIDKTSAVDFIGRFERLERDWKFVCDQIGVPSNLGHSHAGKFVGSDYEHLYTPEAKAVIAEIYAEDFRLFGYKI